MNRCYFLIGPPGVGKTTWCEANAERLGDAVRISSDDLIEEHAREIGSTYAEVFKMRPFGDWTKLLRARMARAVLEQRDILIDRTNCVPTERQALKRFLTPGYETVGVVFEFEAGALFRRCKERGKLTGKVIPPMAIGRIIKSFVAPLPGEFDHVETVPFTKAF